MDKLSQIFEHQFQFNLETDCIEPDDTRMIVYVDENQSEVNKITADVLNFVETLTKSIILLNLKESDTNSIFKLCADLIKNVNELNSKLIENENGLNAQQVLELTTDLIRGKVFQLGTSFRRKKDAKSNPLYVAPKELSIGTRYELIKTKKRGEIAQIPRLIQSTFQYISILETIKSLFRCNEFRDLYFEYNHGRDHVCQPGTYKDFCCGDNFKKIELFQRFPHSLQLQIASDDFEICNALSSKANLHKICPVYFTIQNLPKRFLSKVKNIYPVCLSNSDDLKTKFTDFNNIWYPIVNEITHLETTGIDIDAKTNLKGTITTLAFDNLGANTSLGFVGSFSASHYCRDCEASNIECQTMTSEDVAKIRTKESYNKQIEIVNESVTVDYEQTKGVKYYCKLSDLKYFHIIDNPTADIMHDVNEGAIPFMLRLLFQKCIDAKLFTASELNSMVQFYDYGFLSRRNIPSEINLKKRSLGQNASQSLCLFRHIPFILFKFRENSKLQDLWLCFQSFLRMVEILYSPAITELNLCTYIDMTHTFLEGIKKLGKKFIPKLHFFLHFPRTIRLNGPLVHMSMMRYESKHKVFKDFRKTTNNFKNINKTLAIKHQKLSSRMGFTYVDNVENGAPIPLDDDSISKHAHILAHTFGEAIEKVRKIKWLRMNNYEYRPDLLILYENSLFQIQQILMNGNHYFFLSRRYNSMDFNSFVNSFEVVETTELVLISFSDLKYCKSYEMKSIESVNYVTADTLELRNQLCLPPP